MTVSVSVKRWLSTFIIFHHSVKNQLPQRRYSTVCVSVLQKHHRNAGQKKEKEKKKHWFLKIGSCWIEHNCNAYTWHIHKEWRLMNLPQWDVYLLRNELKSVENIAGDKWEEEKESCRRTVHAAQKRRKQNSPWSFKTSRPKEVGSSWEGWRQGNEGYRDRRGKKHIIKVAHLDTLNSFWRVWLSAQQIGGRKQNVCALSWIWKPAGCSDDSSAQAAP